MKLLKVIRKFERFNFHGVPEGPELSFERDNYAQFTERQTGRSVTPFSNEVDLENASLIGHVIDNFEQKKEVLVENKLD